MKGGLVPFILREMPKYNTPLPEGSVKLRDLNIGDAFKPVGKEEIMVKLTDDLVEWHDQVFMSDPDLYVVPVSPEEYRKSIKEGAAI